MWDVDHSFLQVMFSRETAKIGLVGRVGEPQKGGSYYPEGLAVAPGDELPQTSTSSVLSDFLDCSLPRELYFSESAEVGAKNVRFPW